MVMYMHEPGESMVTLEPLSPGIRTTLWAAALGTLILGIFPLSAAQLRKQFQRPGEVAVSLVVGQDGILQWVVNPRRLRRLAVGAQVTNLPHTSN